MIEVNIQRTGDDGSVLPLAQIRVTREGDIAGTSAARYSVNVAVDRGGEVGLYSRQITVFHRKTFNVLALLQAALDTLDSEQMELVDASVLSSDLAWGFPDGMPALQAGVSGLHHHGPSVRSGQPEQHGSDS
jgi:hypothetical protein